MDFYRKLPTNFLLARYNEVIENIKEGKLTRNIYFELGLLISVAHQRGITLSQSSDINK